MGGGHRTEKFVLEGGDTAHTFLMSGTNVVETPHKIERNHLLGGGDTAHTLLGWGPGLEKVWYPGILVTSQCQIWQPILAWPKALPATNLG